MESLFDCIFRLIQWQICDTIPFVSEHQELSVLSDEYTDNVYSAKVRDLSQKYKAIRKTRPDGNCFFRAFAYNYLEYLVTHKEDYEPFRRLAEESKDRLIKLGFPPFTLEDFHDTVSCCSCCCFCCRRRCHRHLLIVLVSVYASCESGCAVW